MNAHSINLQSGGAVLVMLRTSEKWGAEFGAPANNDPQNGGEQK